MKSISITLNRLSNYNISKKLLIASLLVSIIYQMINIAAAETSLISIITVINLIAWWLEELK